MNKLKYLLSAFVLLCFASCKDDSPTGEPQYHRRE